MQENQRPKKQFWRSLTYWVHHHKKLAITLGIALVLLIGAGVGSAIYFMNQKEPEPIAQNNEEPEPEPEPVKYYSELTGKEVESEVIANQAVTAIMIENSPDSRPQSGLKDSGVVFEAIAEGGITRFLVLYQQEKPQLIGPVRSVRMYYVDWLTPFDASVAHVGGSSRALSLLRNGTYRDIDQFFNPATYWRASDRYAPHNVYTSFKNIDALNKSKKYTSSDFTGFTRSDTTPSGQKAASRVNVTISSSLYNSSYVYDAKSKLYKRSQAGAAHTDREKGQIAPRVVIAMMVDQTRVFEDGYRESIKTVGSGTAYIFQNGTVQAVTWSKKSRQDQIRFTNKAGEEVPLARGQTWISAVPKSGGDVTWR